MNARLQQRRFKRFTAVAQFERNRQGLVVRWADCVFRTPLGDLRSFATRHTPTRLLQVRDSHHGLYNKIFRTIERFQLDGHGFVSIAQTGWMMFDDFRPQIPLSSSPLFLASLSACAVAHCIVIILRSKHVDLAEYINQFHSEV